MALKRTLREDCGVGLSGEVYDTPCHLQPVFAEFSAGDFPIAADICAQHVCLPVHAAMKDEEAQFVVSSISKSLKSLLKGTLV